MKSKSCRPLSTVQYSTVKFTGEILVIVGRVLRSFLFNILVFVLGFSCAYIFLLTKIQINCVHADDKFVQRIEHDVRQQKIIVDNLEQFIKNYKHQISRNIINAPSNTDN